MCIYVGDMYQGINDIYGLPLGFKFEVQYHTPQSWDMKAESHKIYEAYRECQNDFVAQKALFEKGAALANAIAVPEGYRDIEKLTKQPEPDLLTLFAHQIRENCLKVSALLDTFLTELSKPYEPQWIEVWSALSICICAYIHSRQNLHKHKCVPHTNFGFIMTYVYTGVC
jgi:hypothetical protein